jgi:Protein of unknown function (DUF3800)
MSFLLFMDESGHDRVASPREVLAGIAIEDQNLWNFVCAVHDAEMQFFGGRISAGQLELKGEKLLKRKVFRHASQLESFAPEERVRLARACLERGAASKGESRGGGTTRAELTALGQAKLAFVEKVLAVCGSFQVRALASIIPRAAPRTAGDFLRKDYAYLFERYFYFLEERGPDAVGLVIFDEREKTLSHLLVDQLTRYFRETAKGRIRASKIVPEPFFVHSDLTTAVQVADLIAYITAWGVDLGREPAERPELAPFADLVCELRHKSKRQEPQGEERTVWSFAWIDDLRPRDERRSG